MSFEVAGKLKVVGEPRTFASGFVKREFVVTIEEGKYPQDIVFELMQDRVSQTDDLRIGDGVEVFFDLRGREYNDRYFNTLVCWRVRKEVVDPYADAPPDKPTKNPSGQQETQASFDDEIPF